jgi:hypothetical protein
MKTSSQTPLPPLTNGIYAIAGLSKNSGKTSLLNYLLEHYRDKPTGVLTTGRDGEAKDELYGHPKPPVKLAKGTLFTAVSDALDKQGTAVEILDKLAFSAGNKQLWLAKALHSIQTEITGPAGVSAQVQTAELMQAQGAEIVFIDGSLDRKSIALHPSVKGVFLVAGGSFGSLEKIIAELDRMFALAAIKQIKTTSRTMYNHLAIRSKNTWSKTEYTSLLGCETDICGLLADPSVTGLYLPGAVTDSSFQTIKPALNSIRQITVRHPLNLHLSKANLTQLLESHTVTCLTPFRIIALAVNSWSVNGNHLDSKVLRQTLRRLYKTLPVLDIYEG